MSGSGSGFGGGLSDDVAISCDRLIIETTISSPKESVIAKLSANNFLQVELEQVGATSVVVLMYQREKAGGITHAQTNRLRECIQGGTKYTATVISKSDGQVRVRIKPV
ncbi:hypothetical protein [Solilutibacter silvestris]|uniref:hypothetical protein n=1 Tax=Solilutibacter silvestris TaxID=1645665 RepID=UPI00101AE1F5|nr:hypothetical protein [Lysobacter silvestris]